MVHVGVVVAKLLHVVHWNLKLEGVILIVVDISVIQVHVGRCIFQHEAEFEVQLLFAHRRNSVLDIVHGNVEVE